MNFLSEKVCNNQQSDRLLSVCAEDAPRFLNAVYNKKYTREKIASRFAQSGRSMIEMLGVLAIVGVLSVGGIFGYSKAMQKQRLNNIRNQISHIVAGVRQFYISQGNFDGLNTEVAIDAGIIPDDMEIGTAEGGTVSVKNVYGGNIFVEVNPDSDEPEFVVIIEHLPKDALIDVSTADWKSDEGLRAIEIINNDE